MSSHQLYLYEVLEEEYISLQGTLPESYNTAKKDILKKFEKEPDRARREEEINKALVKELYEHIHQAKWSALCLSGGGIRSASFGLGVLQGLARKGLLDQFEYLSTVSGGGYLGSWLSAWIDRHPKGLSGVADDLANLPRNGASGSARSPLQPEPESIRHLRNYSNYLSPKLGLLSADSWTLVAIVLRNLILIWLVLIPLLGAALMIPRLGMVAVNWSPGQGARSAVLWLSFGLAVVCMLVSIIYIGLNRPSAIGAKHKPKGQGTFLALCLVPLLLSAILFSSYWAWLRHPDSEAYSRDVAEARMIFEAEQKAEKEKANQAAAQSGQPQPAATDEKKEPDLSQIEATYADRMEAQLKDIGIFGKQPLNSLVTFLVFGMLLHFAGWVIYAAWLRVLRGYEALLAIATGVVGGWFAWLAATKAFPFPSTRSEIYVCIAASLFLMLFLLTVTLFAGLSSRWTKDEDREWWARLGAWILITSVVWSVVSVVVIFGPVLLSNIPEWIASVGGLSGLITIILGRSHKTSANDKQKEKAGVSAVVMDKAVMLAAPLFAAFIVIVISTVISILIPWLAGKLSLGVAEQLSSALQSPLRADWPAGHRMVLLKSPFWFLAILMAALALFSVLVAIFINTNKFSLHAMYRNRLIRAYLGASRSSKERKPNPFTGFDEKDDIPIHKLWPNKANTKEANKGRNKLLHVVNMALNLVHGDELAWQQRKAETFTSTPLHSGNYLHGYRRSESYGGEHGISLGTAATISGAAASPNMGYHSSPFVTFLLTLFNGRLGAWLGNPGPSGQNTYRLEFPKLSLITIIAEMFGLTSDKSPYIYLSDGGHFENLGLYEMVLRRCHYIVVSDGSQDSRCSFEDLGGAVRKIRIDLGVPIEFERTICIYPRSEDKTQNKLGRYCAIGKILYSRVDGDDKGDQAKDGYIIYIKPAFYGNEPRDIYQYARANEIFPHESTADQFFSESQFESYRMLGLHAVEQMSLNYMLSAGLEGWRGHIETKYLLFTDLGGNG